MVAPGFDCGGFYTRRKSAGPKNNSAGPRRLTLQRSQYSLRSPPSQTGMGRPACLQQVEWQSATADIQLAMIESREKPPAQAMRGSLCLSMPHDYNCAF